MVAGYDALFVAVNMGGFFILPHSFSGICLKSIPENVKMTYFIF